MAEVVFTARDLVTSQACLPSSMLVKELVDWFKEDTTREYAAVIAEGNILGLVSREGLNAKLAASEVGFSVFSNRPITRMMLTQMLVVGASDTIPLIVHRLQTERQGVSQFYDDIVVHDEGRFLGLASVKQLVILQMQQIQQQMEILERQQAALLQKNRELLEANFSANTESHHFRSFFESSSIPIVVFNLQGDYLEANPRFRRLAGYEPGQLTTITRAFHLFQGGIETQLKDCLSQNGAATENRPTYYLTMLRASGQHQGVEVSLDVNHEEQKILCSIVRVLDKAESAIRNRVLEDVTNAHTELRGTLGELSIIDLAQLLVQSRKTGQLHITTDDGLDHQLFFEAGHIVHAQSDDIEGKSVLRRLVMLRRGQFLFSNDQTAPRRTLQGDSMGLLLDACAEGDEGSSYDFTLGSNS
jgi:PAS domain S-box-containing protein